MKWVWVALLSPIVVLAVAWELIRDLGVTAHAGIEWWEEKLTPWYDKREETRRFR